MDQFVYRNCIYKVTQLEKIEYGLLATWKIAHLLPVQLTYKKEYVYFDLQTSRVTSKNYSLVIGHQKLLEFVARLMYYGIEFLPIMDDETIRYDDYYLDEEYKRYMQFQESQSYIVKQTVTPSPQYTQSYANVVKQTVTKSYADVTKSNLIYAI